MRSFLILLLSAATAFSEPEAGDDAPGMRHFRTGPPKDCYLEARGKGPKWIAKVTAEFQLNHFSWRRPVVVDTVFEPKDENAFSWVPAEGGPEPEIRTIGNVEGRNLVEIVYPEEGVIGKRISLIMLAIETARESEWYAPFFCADPEIFRGHFVSGKDVTFGYVATLAVSGTGSFRTHRLFDLRKPHPVMVGEFGSAGASAISTDEADEEKVRGIYEQEAAFLGGTLPEK